MSAYIPYMKIPEHCGQCRFADRENRIYCSFDGILREEGKITQDDCFIDAETKPEWCPIQEGEHIPVKAVLEIIVEKWKGYDYRFGGRMEIEAANKVSNDIYTAVEALKGGE